MGISIEYDGAYRFILVVESFRTYSERHYFITFILLYCLTERD
jgi:hypothetical protein